MRLRPPRPPGERARRERQVTEVGCRAEKVSVFGAKSVPSAIHAARPDFAFPWRGRCPKGRCGVGSACGTVYRRKSYFMLRNALSRYTSSVGSADTFPSKGKAIQLAAECLTVRALTCPRCATCTESSPLIPHAVVVSLPSAGVKGVSPLQLFLFQVFLSVEKEKRIGSDAVG